MKCHSVKNVKLKLRCENELQNKRAIALQRNIRNLLVIEIIFQDSELVPFFYQAMFALVL